MLQHLKVWNTFANSFDLGFMHYRFYFLILFIFSVFLGSAQQQTNSLLTDATLDNIVQYALKHYPLLRQSLLDEKITDASVNAKLADWGPQVVFGITPQHYFQRPQVVFGGNVIQQGTTNSSPITLSATQNLINRDVILASITAKDLRKQSKQNTENLKINLVVSVSKAFYATLATMQQIEVGKEEITRLERSLQDAQSRYSAGVTDKTDYKRAAIALNNSRASLASNLELLKANKEYLKALIGYPVEHDLQPVYNFAEMEQQIISDTFAQPDYRSRIEYQQLALSKKLQKANLNHSYMSFIPTITLNGAYNVNYFSMSNSLKELYRTPLPNNYVSLGVVFPIFNGGKVGFNIRQQKLQLERIDYSIKNLENTVNAEHAQAIANYKSYLAKYNALHENLTLAQDVYDVINLQYKSGVKTYLEVITAETDLRNAKINYYNGLYQVLSAKMDLQKALGLVKW